MIQIETIANFEELLKIEKDWNFLVNRSNNNNPALTFEWISSWWKSYGNENDLIILLAKENDGIIGIAPLMKTLIEYRGMWLKSISFIAYRHGNLNGFIIADRKREIINAMIKDLQKNFSGLCMLNHLTRGTEEDVILSEMLLDKKMKVIRYSLFDSPYIKIEVDWNSYILTRSKHFRQNLRTLDNSFQRVTDHEIIKYTDKDIDKALQELLSVSRNTWKYNKGSAIASRPKETLFYSSLAQEFSKRGWLNLWLLRIKAQPVAFVYAVIYRNKTFCLKIGYDERYSKLYPCEYLCSKVIKNCFDEKMIEYDWCGKLDPFKMKWTKTFKEGSTYFICGKTFPSKFIYYFETLARFKRDVLKKIASMPIVSVLMSNRSKGKH